MSYKWWVITIVTEINIHTFIYFGTPEAAIQFAAAELVPDYTDEEIMGFMVEDQETFTMGNEFMEGIFK